LHDFIIASRVRQVVDLLDLVYLFIGEVDDLRIADVMFSSYFLKQGVFKLLIIFKANYGSISRKVSKTLTFLGEYNRRQTYSTETQKNIDRIANPADKILIKSRSCAVDFDYFQLHQTLAYRLPFHQGFQYQRIKQRGKYDE